MRYALISDIHANLPALEAVLADIDARSGIDSDDFAEYLRFGGQVPAAATGTG